MNKVEISKNNMYKKVKGFLELNASVFTGFTRLNSEITRFAALNASLDGHIEVQDRTITGITADKDDVLSDLRRQLVKSARKALIYAKDQSNNELINIFDIRESNLRLSQTETIAKAKNITASLQAHALPLVDYNITAADLTALNTAITGLESIMPSTGNATSSRTAATTAIKSIMKELDDSLEIMDDLIATQYEDDQPSLVDEYFNNRKIDGPSFKVTGLSLTVSDTSTGVPLRDARMNIASIDKTAFSNMQGVAEIIRMRPGIYEVNLEAHGYQAQQLTIRVDRGEVLAMKVGMKKEG